MDCNGDLTNGRDGVRRTQSGQLSASQPHCCSSYGPLHTHCTGWYHILCPAWCPEGKLSHQLKQQSIFVRFTLSFSLSPSLIHNAHFSLADIPRILLHSCPIPIWISLQRLFRIRNISPLHYPHRSKDIREKTFIRMMSVWTFGNFRPVMFNIMTKRYRYHLWVQCVSCVLSCRLPP